MTHFIFGSDGYRSLEVNIDFIKDQVKMSLDSPEESLRLSSAMTIESFQKQMQDLLKRIDRVVCQNKNKK